MISLLQKQPGAKFFVLIDFDELFTGNDAYQEKVVYVVRNQREKDTLDGYCLMYGKNRNIVVGKHTLAPSCDDPYLFLWVVEIEELS